MTADQLSAIRKALADMIDYCRWLGASSTLLDSARAALAMLDEEEVAPDSDWAEGGGPVESGWLIEDRGPERNGPSLYWTGSPLGRGGEWSFSPERAIRFARKTDAVCVITGMMGLSTDNGDFPARVIAAEHQWG